MGGRANQILSLEEEIFSLNEREKKIHWEQGEKK